MAGFLWRLAPRWRTGGFFRQGPEFASTSTTTAGPLNFWDLPVGSSRVILRRPMVFPDAYGLGFSYRARGERLTLACQWERIGYSSLLGYFNANGYQNELEDGDELHVGAEYLYLRSKPAIAVRVGAWTDPAHRIHDDSHYVTRAVLPHGENELHLSAGLGVVFWELQLDVAVDFSDRVDAISLSTIYSF
ncbi:MAG: hypothetical protein OES32_10420 [Acidobacteriota bacterium]|nr:hypothetical protein [Acidobacteriota bacterium]MDH3523989.1 hypothetical protein [Acidobacteriota bacterium]